MPNGDTISHRYYSGGGSASVVLAFVGLLDGDCGGNVLILVGAVLVVLDRVLAEDDTFVWSFGLRVSREDPPETIIESTPIPRESLM